MHSFHANLLWLVGLSEEQVQHTILLCSLLILVLWRDRAAFCGSRYLKSPLCQRNEWRRCGTHAARVCVERWTLKERQRWVEEKHLCLRSVHANKWSKKARNVSSRSRPRLHVDHVKVSIVCETSERASPFSLHFLSIITFAHSAKTRILRCAKRWQSKRSRTTRWSLGDPLWHIQWAFYLLCKLFRNATKPGDSMRNTSESGIPAMLETTANV